MIFTITTFYQLQVGWYVFGTFVAFLAALLFWNKGSAAIKGQLSHSGKAVYKFTGAGAIFLAILVLFKWLNPVLPISDYKRLIILHSDKSIAELGPKSLSEVVIKINKGDNFWEHYGNHEGVIEMIPTKYIFNLVKTIDGKGLSTGNQVPKGKYLIRVFKKDEGGYIQRIAEIS
jgi:hypothetical protein